MKVTRQIILITPEMAAKCLEKNPLNRSINWDWVNYLAQLILNGQFVTTHQGIAFDVDKNLIDGQHRLLAIIKAGIPVKIEVSYGWPRSHILAIDTGKTRRFNDRAKFLGRTERQDDLAIAKILEYGPIKYCVRISPEQEFDLVEKYREGIEFAKTNLAGHKKYYVVPVQAITARASYTQDKDRLKIFIRTITSGEMLDRTDQAAIKLRDIIIQYRALKRQLIRNPDFYYKAECALRAFLLGKPLSKLYPVEGEIFKLPMEM